MTLLTTVNNAQDRIGMPRSTTVVGSTDNDARAMLALANQEGKELARRGPWQSLVREHSFTSIAAETQTSGLPSDFDRILPETAFNRTRKRILYGPLTPQEWQAQKGVVAIGITEAFYIRASAFLVTPIMTAGETVAYEYITTKWCQSSGGTAQAAWAADTDTGILDEELMTQGLIWRFLKARGLDYSEAFRTYELNVAQALGRDGGSKRTINMAGSADDHRPRYPTIPDGNWSVS